MRGITLVELLCVIVVVTLLASYSLQGWQSIQQRLVLQQASSSLANFLVYVQVVAQQTNQTFTVKRQRMANGYWCLKVSEIPQSLSIANNNIYWEQPDPTVELLENPGTIPEPIFHGEHGTATGSRLRLKCGSYIIQVVLSSKGRLSCCSEQGSFSYLRPCA